MAGVAVYVCADVACSCAGVLLYVVVDATHVDGGAPVAVIVVGFFDGRGHVVHAAADSHFEFAVQAAEAGARGLTGSVPVLRRSTMPCALIS